ncbi:alpha/beta-hydrolase [Aulographum hederae CBS 113979]|uniref:Alpha/beta-hydrolase n=1 Tax=Aulographum hederae CBS 113979 TaxID=1176131 RepID=A0A6G1HBY4_9PEZI|nr:alpha/beta-hydrolase [Aulographum hederae CBS 113979]
MGPSIPVSVPGHATPTRPSSARKHPSRRARDDSRPKTTHSSHPRPTSPAAPREVISSLIDSLAHISDPANDHFSHMPVVGGDASTPSSPTTWGDMTRQMDAAEPDYTSYYRHGTDVAAEAPVIKTSRPPSGRSSLTAPKSKDGNHSFKGLLTKSSRTSLVSIQDIAEEGKSLRSPRSPSVDTAPPRSRGASSPTKRTSHRLASSGSKENTRSKEKERKRPGTGSDQLTSPNEAQESPAFKERRASDQPGPVQDQRPSSEGPNRSPELPMSAVRAGKRAVSGDMSMGQIPVVPLRMSSLRQRDGSRRRRTQSMGSRTSSVLQSHIAETTPEEPSEADSKLPTPAFSPSIIDEIDTDVTKRIKELKTLKELREKEARTSGETSSDASKTADPHARRTSRRRTLPDASHYLLNEDKTPTQEAHSHIPFGEIRPKSSGNPNYYRPTTPGTVNGVASHSRSARPKTPGTPLTPLETFSPLPINYNFVVSTLDEISSASDKASSKATSISTSTTNTSKTARSKTVGGRSAVSRKATNSMVDKRSDSGTAANKLGGLPDRARKSEESSNEKWAFTLAAPPLARQKSQNKKKRWSHPDLPLRAEPKGVMQETQNPRGMKAPETVPEERPTSSDSIDDDVETFIRAPRLSQKIKHPQTGRVISFSEVGDPKGDAVFCCVGMGLTRFVTAFYDELALTLKLRLITPDRPGVGESEPDPAGTPLSWPDDVTAICQHLHITKYSIVAHSAGAMYALATALRMPQNVRGRVHLLAPWIPPSQMSPIGVTNQSNPAPAGQLPKSQRFLRVLPASFLKVANSGFLNATSASISRKDTGTPPAANSDKSKRKSVNMTSSKSSDKDKDKDRSMQGGPVLPHNTHTRRESIMLMDQQSLPNHSALSLAHTASYASLRHIAAANATSMLSAAQAEYEAERRKEYDTRLTLAIWHHATKSANPALDLKVCLERVKPIGFRYVDITRAVVIHHGSRDTRVPVENVRWLGGCMKRCEVRILEGEGHGLMASASVMGDVLGEMAGEWMEWKTAAAGGSGSGGRRRRERERERELREARAVEAV